MGLFDDLSPIESFFDFDSDGKLDSFEEASYRQYEYERLEKLFSKPKPAQTDDWQEFCKDGSEYDLEPWMCEDEEDYEIALEAARLDNTLLSCDESYDDYNDTDEDYDDL